MKNSQSTPWRIFVSSTKEDLLPYRQAVEDALTGMELVPLSMKYFVSAPENTIDASLSAVRRSQLYIIIVGMRYGSIVEGVGKSYTELEYDEAVNNKLPILAFIIDEESCPVLPKFVDTGDKAEKLAAFKEKLKASHLVSYFKSPDDLKLLVSRSVQKTVEKISEDQIKKIDSSKKDDREDYIVGAELFRRFILLPKRYSGREAILRIRMDGQFGTWKVKDEIFEAFGFDSGDAIFGNDATVIGADFEDIDENVRTIDFFAAGESADWILDNKIGTGTIFEGKFKFDYKPVEEIARRSYGNAAVNIAALVLLEGKAVIGKEANKRKARAMNSHLFDHINPATIEDKD